MNTAIIGSDLWGAAAACHLAKAGCDVTLIGPNEPTRKATHNDVFASHNDEGRITRKDALDPFWCGVGTVAIDHYGQIERESDISFYAEAGAAMAGPPDWLARVDAGRQEYDVACDMLDHENLADRFPFFSFPDDFAGYHETTRAGHISARRIVAAQIKAAMSHGPKRLAVEAVDFLDRDNCMRVTTDTWQWGRRKM